MPSRVVRGPSAFIISVLGCVAGVIATIVALLDYFFPAGAAGQVGLC